MLRQESICFYMVYFLYSKSQYCFIVKSKAMCHTTRQVNINARASVWYPQSKHSSKQPY